MASAEGVQVVLTPEAPAVEGELVVRINEHVRGEWWDGVDEDASSLKDWFEVRIDLSPATPGLRATMVPVDGPDAVVTGSPLELGDGHVGIPFEGWHRERRTGFVGGGTFDLPCPLDQPCEVVFRYRIEPMVPMAPGERIEIEAESTVQVMEMSASGPVARGDGAEMSVEMGAPSAAPAIVEAFEIGTVAVTGRKHRGRFEVPVTLRFPEARAAEVVGFSTRDDPHVRFVQDDPVIVGKAFGEMYLREVPLMIGDCGDECAIEGRLFTEVEPNAGQVTFWAHVRSGWNLHDPPSDLTVEVDLASEALPPPQWMQADPDD